MGTMKEIHILLLHIEIKANYKWKGITFQLPSNWRDDILDRLQDLDNNLRFSLSPTIIVSSVCVSNHR